VCLKSPQKPLFPRGGGVRKIKRGTGDIFSLSPVPLFGTCTRLHTKSTPSNTTLEMYTALPQDVLRYTPLVVHHCADSHSTYVRISLHFPRASRGSESVRSATAFLDVYSRALQQRFRRQRFASFQLWNESVYENTIEI